MEIVELLSERTWEGKWDCVVKIYTQFPWTHMEKISDSSGNTALHAAVDSGPEDTVDQLVKLILDHENKHPSAVDTGPEGQTGSSHQPHQEAQKSEITESEEFKGKLEKRAKVRALEIKNANGDTPLHLAASRGFMKKCICIVGIDPSVSYSFERTRQDLARIRNEKGETPLFVAALNWHKQTFVYLNDFVGIAFPDELRRNNGDTIFHCAIQREHYDLAAIILWYYYDWVRGSINKEGFTPLKLLATKRSAFFSSSYLNWWDKIVYRFLPVEPADVEIALGRIRVDSGWESSLSENSHPKNWVTCCNVINLLLRFGSSFVSNIVSGKEREDIEGEPGVVVPPVYATWRTFLEMVVFVFVCLIGSNRIKIMKHKHLWGRHILNELMKEPSQSYRGESKDPSFPTDAMKNIEAQAASFPKQTQYSEYPGEDNKATSPPDQTNTEAPENEKNELDSTPDKKETALLTAAKNGIVEIVDDILKKVPVAIQDENSQKKNVLHAAVQNRQPLIVKALERQKLTLWDNLLLEVDNKENTILHMAAEAINIEQEPWKIAGVAMQMTWDVKWYEYIKGLVPPHFQFRNNNVRKTPWEIFNETHKRLVSEGKEWLKDTAESCSVVVALIAGVSFATSSTVPGGNIEQTGKPALEGHPAFTLFAMTSLVSLCFSVTALIMFLSILTSRKQAKDFRRDLPLKLLLGLSSLFVSIASMFISFCAGHFFVLRDKYKNTIFPIYAATCFPVTLYAVYQFPLYYDILRAIFAEVPLARDKDDDS